jgi:hypothetical protein
MAKPSVSLFFLVVNGIRFSVFYDIYTVDVE